MDTKVKKERSLQYYMRAIHRVLGYLAVGLVMVYALSGITMIYRTSDFMKKSTEVEMTLDPNLDVSQLGAALKIKNFKVTEQTPEIITFSDGTYNVATGEVVYTKKDVVAPFNKFIDLHKLPIAKNISIAIITTIFGIILFLLALTSLFMYRPSAKQFRANMLYVSLGVALAVILVLAM